MLYVFFFFFLFSLSLFSLWLPSAFLIFSPLLQNFTLFLQQKNVCVVFCLSLWLFFSGVELAGLSPYFLFFSVFNSLSLYSKFVGIAINVSLILQTTRLQKHFPLSVFVFVDSLIISASQDAGGLTLSRQNNLTFGIGLYPVGVRTVGVRTLRHN